MKNYKSEITDRFGDIGPVFNTNEFIDYVHTKIPGYNKDNSLLVFATCPDDLNRHDASPSIEIALKNVYGRGYFILGGLGAIPIQGLAGIIAASHHPGNKSDGKPGNLIFYLSPHTSLSFDLQKFIWGEIIRPNQQKHTASCGAMAALYNTLKEKPNYTPVNNPLDISNIYFQQSIITEIPNIPNLLDLDKNDAIVQLAKINLSSVTKAFSERLDKVKIDQDYAIISGITINTIKGDYFVLSEIQNVRH